MALQERQRLLIELLDILVERRVRSSLEDQQLGIANATLQSIRETGRCQLIVAPECDLRRRGDAPELRFHVVSDHGIRLLDEVRHGLRRPAADETRPTSRCSLAGRHTARV